MKVAGTKQLGGDLQQWQGPGSPGINHVGSYFTGGHEVEHAEAEKALRELRTLRRGQRSAADLKHLDALIHHLKHRIDVASVRGNPGNSSARRTQRGVCACTKPATKFINNVGYCGTHAPKIPQALTVAGTKVVHVPSGRKGTTSSVYVDGQWVTYVNNIGAVMVKFDRPISEACWPHELKVIRAAAKTPRDNPRKAKAPASAPPATMTAAQAEDAIPKSQIGFIVDRYHVATPVEEITERIRAMAVKNKWPQAAITAATKYAAKRHGDNIKTYNAVMRGSF